MGTCGGPAHVPLAFVHLLFWSPEKILNFRRQFLRLIYPPLPISSYCSSSTSQVTTDSRSLQLLRPPRSLPAEIERGRQYPSRACLIFCRFYALIREYIDSRCSKRKSRALYCLHSAGTKQSASVLVFSRGHRWKIQRLCKIEPRMVLLRLLCWKNSLFVIRLIEN